jgi:hypothetical protein
MAIGRTSAVVKQPSPSTNGNAQPRTKMDKAKVIYTNGRKEGLARKAIIDTFITEAGLTRKGSATYFQLLKTKEAQGKP